MATTSNSCSDWLISKIFSSETVVRPIWTLYFYQGKGKVVLQSQLFLKDVMGRDDSNVNNGFRGEDFRNQPIRTRIACSGHVCKQIVMK
jgi:hypothetical protein